jgi:hypothetical protein
MLYFAVEVRDILARRIVIDLVESVVVRVVVRMFFRRRFLGDGFVV